MTVVAIQSCTKIGDSSEIWGIYDGLGSSGQLFTNQNRALYIISI